MSVMVVEDDPDAREALEQFLEIFGYEAVTAKNGSEALSILKSGVRPELILLDLMMPVMDGWQFVDEIARDPELRQTPIAVTSACDSEPPKPPVSAGVFRKPIVLPQLLAMLRDNATPVV